MSSSPSWSQFEPMFRELEARPVTLATVEAWLHDWSEAEKELLEQRAALSRARNEDTRDKAAEAAYLTFVHEVQPQLTVSKPNPERLREAQLSQRGDRLAATYVRHDS